MLKLIFVILLLLPPLAQAQKLEQLVAEAKKEGEVTLVASTSTFGGKKGFAELEALFAKRYGFKAKLNLSGGPSFPQMAARIITEQKAGSKSSAMPSETVVVFPVAVEYSVIRPMSLDAGFEYAIQRESPDQT